MGKPNVSSQLASLSSSPTVLTEGECGILAYNTCYILHIHVISQITFTFILHIMHTYMHMTFPNCTLWRWKCVVQREGRWGRDGRVGGKGEEVEVVECVKWLLYWIQWGVWMFGGWGRSVKSIERCLNSFKARGGGEEEANSCRVKFKFPWNNNLSFLGIIKG